MAPLGMAFGKPLRYPSWRRLSVRQRFALEALEFGAIHLKARKELSVFWHNAHVPLLALTARVDCAGSLNICLNAADPGLFLPALAGLLWCSGLTIVRDTVDMFLRPSLCMVPIPPDFAGFEDDSEFQGKEPPPVLGPHGQFNLTSSMVQTASGPAAVALGTVPIHERLFEWLHGAADGIYETGRVFLGAFLPPTFVEAAFLGSGLYFHRSTGLLPMFVGDPPWFTDGAVTSHRIRLPYLQGCSVSDMATVAESRYSEIDARARTVRSLIDRAERSHVLGADVVQRTRWEADRDAWERAQVRFLEDVLEETAGTRVGGTAASIQTAAITVHISSNVPRGGAWVESIPALERDIETYASSPAADELRQGPFAFATLAL